MNRTHRRRRAGFTLLEMMLVIALIGLLIGVGVVKFEAIFGGAEKSIAQTFVDSTGKTALFSYRMHMGSYPTTAQGLAALITSPEGGGSRWAGPYFEAKGGKIPEDPWKRPYQYRFPGTKNPTGYDLFSFGPDGVESDDDIKNW